MKFHEIPLFERYLQELPKGRHFFAVIASDLLERESLSSSVISTFKKECPSIDVVLVDLSEVTVDALRSEFTNIDLFTTKKIVHLKRLDQAPKAVLEALYSFLNSDGDMPSVLFEGEHIKSDTKFYDKVGKKLVLMDLTKEKPWERKNRLLAWVNAFANKNKKSIQKDVVELLYERCHKDLSQMIQEVEKLMCYAKDVSVITREHINTLCGLKEEEAGWSFAETIVWEQKGVAVGAACAVDASNFYSLLGQLRYHYQIAVKLRQLIDMQVEEQDIPKYFPTLQPKTLQKYCNAIRNFRGSDLNNALNILFESEVKSKSQSIDLNLLWIDLLAQLSKK